MKTFVIGLAALPFILAGGPVVAADVLNDEPIIVAADESMESTEPPFADVKPGDEPMDSEAGAPDDETDDMSMEPSDQEDMDDSMSDDSMSDDSME